MPNIADDFDAIRARQSELSDLDRELIELEAEYQKARAAVDAFHGDDKAFNKLQAIASEAEAQLIRTPARTLQGLLIKVRAAARLSLESSCAVRDRSALDSPDAAYREVLRDDAEYYALDDTVALMTIWADLERMIGKGAA